LETHGMELENMFEEPSVLGSPEVDVPLSVSETT
jgi:hypothetical protein